MKKKLEKKTSEGYLVVTINDDDDYFSITGMLWTSKQAYTYESDDKLITGGCIHEIILKHYPNLKPIVDLHLSNLNGVPMHAFANGKHFLEKRDEYPISVAAEHFRISVGEATKLRDDHEKSEFTLHAWFAKQEQRWRDEASEALKLIESL